MIALIIKCILHLAHVPLCRIYASLNWLIIGPDNGLAPVHFANKIRHLFVWLGILHIVPLIFEVLKSLLSTTLGYFWRTGAFYTKHGLTLIPSWMSICIQYKVWHGITHPFQRRNCCCLGMNKCGVRSLIHSQNSTVQPLNFGKGLLISYHTLLGMWFKLIHVNKRGSKLHFIISHHC